jgi:hypothetical protein
MKTLIAIVKVIFFGILTLIVGSKLYTYGGDFIRTTMEHNDPFTDGGKGFGISVLLLVLLILCITGVRRSWVNRHQGTDTDGKRVRRRHRKIDDVIRIPK